MSEPRVQVGPDQITSGKNITGAVISQGLIVKVNAAPTVIDEITLAAANTDAFLGVAMNDIADDAYGDIQTGGVALVLGGAAVAIGARVMSDANGKGITGTATNAILGIAKTVGALNELFEVQLSGPGGAEMP